jgi:hypothetical protein
MNITLSATREKTGEALVFLQTATTTNSDTMETLKAFREPNCFQKAYFSSFFSLVIWTLRRYAPRVFLKRR